MKGVKEDNSFGLRLGTQVSNDSITKTCPCNKQRFFSASKIENFIGKKNDMFLIFAQNIDRGYT